MNDERPDRQSSVDADNPASEEAPALTKREVECLRLASEGYSSMEIGKKLGISARTADFHLRCCREAAGPK